jgi:large subunit ribosomal protein L30
MSKLRITQVKSAIDRTKRQKDTVKALGLKGLHKPIEIETNAQLLGMVKAVQHLLKVEEVK